MISAAERCCASLGGITRKFGAELLLCQLARADAHAQPLAAVMMELMAGAFGCHRFSRRDYFAYGPALFFEVTINPYSFMLVTLNGLEPAKKRDNHSGTWWGSAYLDAGALLWA